MSSCVSTRHFSMVFVVRDLGFPQQCRPAVITHLPDSYSSFRAGYCNIEQHLLMLLVISATLFLSTSWKTAVAPSKFNFFLPESRVGLCHLQITFILTLAHMQRTKDFHWFLFVGERTQEKFYPLSA